jgi:hypothetical protein
MKGSGLIFSGRRAAGKNYPWCDDTGGKNLRGVRGVAGAVERVPVDFYGFIAYGPEVSDSAPS